MRIQFRRRIPLAALLAALLIGCDDDIATPRPPEAAALEAALRVVDADFPGALLGVGGAGDDVWFVGGAETGTVHHLAGDTLRAESIPDGPRLWWVAPTGEPGGAIAGGEGGRILRRVGGVWVADTLALGGPDEAEQLDKAVIWGTFAAAPGDLWAVGGSVRRGGPKGLVLRSTGDGAWRRVEDPALPTLNLYKLWGPAPDDLWIVGEGRVVLRWDGAAFTRHDVGTRDLLLTVHGQGEDAVAVGTGSEGGLLYRLDPATGGWRDVAPAGAPNLNGVFVRADGFVTAVGERGAVLLGDPAGRWHRLAPAAADAIGARTLHAVYEAPEGTIWSVGGDLTAGTNGLIVTTRPAGPLVEMP